jgi:hypothetical protein
MGFADAAVIDERQALAFRILEMDRQPAVAYLGTGMADAMLAEPLRPIVESARARDAERRTGDRIGAAPLRRRRPVEEGEVGSRRGEAVGIEEVIGGDVVLVDGLLDQPEAEDIGVEIDIALGIGRNRGEVVDSGELHDRPAFCRRARARPLTFPRI